MVVVKELPCLSAMVFAILHVVEAGNFGLESCLDSRVLLKLIKEDFKLVELADGFLSETQRLLGKLAVNRDTLLFYRLIHV